MAKYQDVRRSVLTIAGGIYPLGGEDDSIMITPDPAGTMTRGLDSVIFSSEVQFTAVMVVTAYPQDAMYKLLTAKFGRDRVLAASGAPALIEPGEHVNLSAGHIDAWEDMHLLQDFGSGSSKSPGVQTATFGLSGHVRTIIAGS